MYALRVLVDGTEQGRLGGGFPDCLLDLLGSRSKSVTIALPVGERTVEVKGGGMSRNASVKVKPGSTSYFTTFFSNMGAIGGGLNLIEDAAEGAMPKSRSRQLPSQRLPPASAGTVSVSQDAATAAMPKAAALQDRLKGCVSQAVGILPEGIKSKRAIIAVCAATGVSFFLCCGMCGVFGLFLQGPVDSARQTSRKDRMATAERDTIAVDNRESNTQAEHFYPTEAVALVAIGRLSGSTPEETASNWNSITPERFDKLFFSTAEQLGVDSDEEIMLRAESGPDIQKTQFGLMLGLLIKYGMDTPALTFFKGANQTNYEMSTVVISSFGSKEGRRERTFSASEPPTTEDIEAAKASLKQLSSSGGDASSTGGHIITARYCPHMPGAVLNYEVEVHSPDNGVTKRRMRVEHLEEGAVRETESASPLDPPLGKPTLSYHKVEGGFVLLKQGSTWLPELKIGAAEGDHWETDHERFVVKKWEEFKGVPCVTVEKSFDAEPQGTKITIRNVSRYAQGIGLVELEMFVKGAETGKWALVIRKTLLSSTGVSN